MKNSEITIVFDLDGVISDTAKLHYKAWKTMAKNYGMHLTKEQNDGLRGLNRQKTALAICKLNNVHLSEEDFDEFCRKKNDLYKVYLETEMDNSFILGNIDKLLPKLRNEGYKLVVGSSSYNAPTILKNLDLKKYFDFVVNPGSIKNHKPHPEMYVRGVEAVGNLPANAIGVEDAPAGIEGIKNGGMIGIAIKWSTSEELLKNADYILETSSNLTYEFLLKIIDGMKNG